MAHRKGFKFYITFKFRKKDNVWKVCFIGTEKQKCWYGGKMSSVKDRAQDTVIKTVK